MFTRGFVEFIAEIASHTRITRSCCMRICTQDTKLDGKGPLLSLSSFFLSLSLFATLHWLSSRSSSKDQSVTSTDSLSHIFFSSFRCTGTVLVVPVVVRRASGHDFSSFCFLAPLCTPNSRSPTSEGLLDHSLPVHTHKVPREEKKYKNKKTRMKQKHTLSPSIHKLTNARNEQNREKNQKENPWPLAIANSAFHFSLSPSH